ncbi:hypothetical protein PR048_027702 [Dryococelus australis]|uniref:Uncharacterized protein n=1 Tax=Dryococelus australis TaxID=614101 RepID=A0ABQ9GH99_9NEOP|nr:hypothetical protein PR048_027702 [Dryococelus australis]
MVLHKEHCSCRFSSLGLVSSDREYRPVKCLVSQYVIVRLLASHLVNRVRFPAGSLPDFHTSGRYHRTTGFLGDIPFTPLSHSISATCSPRFTLIGFQDLDRTSSRTLARRRHTHPTTCARTGSQEALVVMETPALRRIHCSIAPYLYSINSGKLCVPPLSHTGHMSPYHIVDALAPYALAALTKGHACFVDICLIEQDCIYSDRVNHHEAIVSDGSVGTAAGYQRTVHKAGRDCGRIYPWTRERKLRKLVRSCKGQKVEWLRVASARRVERASPTKATYRKKKKEELREEREMGEERKESGADVLIPFSEKASSPLRCCGRNILEALSPQVGRRTSNRGHDYRLLSSFFSSPYSPPRTYSPQWRCKQRLAVVDTDVQSKPHSSVKHDSKQAYRVNNNAVKTPKTSLYAIDRLREKVHS